jgi:hypothetical protein
VGRRPLEGEDLSSLSEAIDVSVLQIGRLRKLALAGRQDRSQPARVGKPSAACRTPNERSRDHLTTSINLHQMDGIGHMAQS